MTGTAMMSRSGRHSSPGASVSSRSSAARSFPQILSNCAARRGGARLMNAHDQLAIIEQQYDAPLLNRLISIAGVSQSKQNEFTRIIRHWAGLNYACYEDLRHHPSFKEIDDGLKRIREISSNLINCVDYYYVEYELWLAAADGDSITIGFDRVQAARSGISQIQEWAATAINNVKPKKLGRQATSR